MSEIRDFDDYKSKYNTALDYTDLFGGTPSSEGSGFSLSDYASIKNGSYGKILKAYYAKEDAEKAEKNGDSKQRTLLIRSSAEALKKSAEALTEDSLWEKKKIKKKDEKTGEETVTEDYDWDKIVKAVKTFVDDYNSVVEEIGNSDEKRVLRNGVWLTGMTKSTEKLLKKTGITIGKGNKLELDEEEFKEAGIATIKSAFYGYGSFAQRISQKAERISSAAVGKNTYTRNGSYSKVISELAAGKVDEEV